MTVFIDVRYHKIPNIVLILLLLIQLLSRLVQIFTDGFSFSEDLIPHYSTVIFIFLILFFFFSIGTLGAGDVKLITLTALSVQDPLVYVLVIFIWAAFLAILQMVRHGNMCKRISMLTAYLCSVLGAGKAVPYYERQVEISEKKKYSVHLSIPVFMAYLTLLFIQ